MIGAQFIGRLLGDPATDKWGRVPVIVSGGVMILVGGLLVVAIPQPAVVMVGYAMAGYEDGNDFDGDFYGRLGGQVKINTNWGVAADVKFADGDTQFFVGPRITW